LDFSDFGNMDTSLDLVFHKSFRLVAIGYAPSRQGHTGPNAAGFGHAGFFE